MLMNIHIHIVLAHTCFLENDKKTYAVLCEGLTLKVEMSQLRVGKM